MFEVRWTKQFATNYFGQYVAPGGIMFVPATLAIQLHDEDEGWVCEQVNKARLSLLAGNAVIDEKVSIDEVPPTTAVETKSPEAPVTPPDAQGSLETNEAPTAPETQGTLELSAEPAAPASRKRKGAAK